MGDAITARFVGGGPWDGRTVTLAEAPPTYRVDCWEPLADTFEGHLRGRPLVAEYRRTPTLLADGGIEYRFAGMEPGRLPPKPA